MTDAKSSCERTPQMYALKHFAEASQSAMVASSSFSDPEAPKPSRRSFVAVAATSVGVAGGVLAASTLLGPMEPSADVRARPPSRFALDGIVPGREITILWRGKPLFLRHRTGGEIAAAVADDGLAMKQPQRDAQRVKPGQAQWMVLVGVCTYDHCLPFYSEGPHGGWLCHCCGSVYDTSGRARAGPAPRNLEVPAYDFIDVHTVQLA